MGHPLQDFLAGATQKAAQNLEEALQRLPEDKRHYSPMGDARTAADMAAECVILNKATADILRDRVFPADFDMAAYTRAKDELGRDWTAMLAQLRENTAKAIAAIGEVPDSDTGIEIDMPWGAQTVAQIMAYPYWNMAYHEGQVNYIASMLGCLD